MRNLQPGLVDRLIAEQHQIQIEGSGSAGSRPRAAEVGFDPEQAIEQLASPERGLADQHGVQVERLILQPFPFRFGLDDL